jgi:hypothetical protein
MIMYQADAQQASHKAINLTQEQQEIIKDFGTGRMIVCVLAGQHTFKHCPCVFPKKGALPGVKQDASRKGSGKVATLHKGKNHP